MSAPESILDTRVPQPYRYEEYGVPEEIVEAVDCLYRRRNSGQNTELIDAAILRLFQPWIRE